MKVVEYMAEDALTPKTRKELAEALGITPDAAWRTLWNLREAGWVEEASGGYRLAPRIVQISDSFRLAVADTLGRYMPAPARQHRPTTKEIWAAAFPEDMK